MGEEDFDGGVLGGRKASASFCAFTGHVVCDLIERFSLTSRLGRGGRVDGLTALSASWVSACSLSASLLLPEELIVESEYEGFS